MNSARRTLPAALLALTGVAWAGPKERPPFARQTTQVIVPIAGTLDGETEDIALEGLARINSTTFSDPDLGGPPGVVLLIDFIAVIGVGSESHTAYFAHGENRVVRVLRPSDQVELTFPLTPLKVSAIQAAVPVLASFELTFDVDRGQLRAAEATFSTPRF